MLVTSYKLHVTTMMVMTLEITRRWCLNGVMVEVVVMVTVLLAHLYM